MNYTSTHTAKLLTHVHTDLPMRWNQHTSHLRSARSNRTSKLWKWWHLDRFWDSVKYHLNSKMLHVDCRTELKSKNISILFWWNSLRRCLWTNPHNKLVFWWLDESHENMLVMSQCKQILKLGSSSLSKIKKFRPLDRLLRWNLTQIFSWQVSWDAPSYPNIQRFSNRL